MRLSFVWTVFCKELTEALRDRLTLLVVIGLPLLVYPGSALVLTRLTKSHLAAEDRRVSEVALWGPATTGLLAALGKEPMLKVEADEGLSAELQQELAAGRLRQPALTNPVPEDRSSLARGVAALQRTEPDHPLLSAARALILERKLDAVVVVWPGFEEAVQHRGQGNVTVYFDTVRMASAKAWARVEQQLEAYRQEVLQARWEALGLPGTYATAVAVRPMNVAPPRRVIGDVVGRLLPLLLMMLSAVGALYAAVDLTAGEKDRATMQTLLCAPVSSLEIVAGKFLAIWCVGLVSATANVVSMALMVGRVVAAVGLAALSPGTLLLALLLLVPATWTIAAVFMAVAALARDVRDAGNFLSAVLMIVIIPVAATAAPGVELDRWTCFVPLVNLGLLLRATFVGGAAPELVLLTLTSAALYAALALLLAARVFGQEQVLLGGRLSWRSFFQRAPGADPRPSPAFAFTFFAAVMVLSFYAGSLVEKRGLTTMILVSQYGFFLLPVALAAWLWKFPLAETFALRRPAARSVVASVLLGCSASVAIAGLVLRLLPPPDSLVRELQDLLLLGDTPAPLWQMWLVLALTPALCEEALFRGLVMSGLRRWGPWAAIGVTALLFGLAHASIYRLLPTFAIGLVLGWVVHRTGSLWCSILVHALNNGLVATVVWHASVTGAFQLEEVGNIPWGLTLAALAVFATGLVLLPRANARQPGFSDRP